MTRKPIPVNSVSSFQISDMVIYKYDKTFEGLLCCLFDTYVNKNFPDQLIPLEGVVPMFAQIIITVSSNAEHSVRVWSALGKKLSKYSLNMIIYVWLSEESNSDYLILKYIRKAIDHKGSHFETNFGDADVLEMQKVARRVGHEGLYLKQFVRFQKTADDIYFAPVSPICNALPLAIDHFKDRFADQRWVIYDTKRGYGYYWDLKTITEITLDDDTHLLSGKLDKAHISDDEILFQEIWKEYFKSLTIKERINPRLHKQHMPKRFWKYLIEK